MTDINCFEWHETLGREDLILSFQGDFNHELVRAILILTESKNIENGPLQSKVFGVIVECLQNIYKHGADKPEGSGLTPGIFLIGKRENEYFIHVGNMVLNSEVDTLKKKIDHLNLQDEKALRAMQQTILKTTSLSEEGNAGIGMIYTKRKSKEDLKYQFHKMDDRISFFALNVVIPINV